MFPVFPLPGVHRPAHFHAAAVHFSGGGPNHRQSPGAVPVRNCVHPGGGAGVHPVRALPVGVPRHE